MGQGLTGGTHTYSQFRDLVFKYIPEGIEVDGSKLKGFRSLIGDWDGMAFEGLIDNSYGGADTFE